MKNTVKKKELREILCRLIQIQLLPYFTNLGFMEATIPKWYLRSKGISRRLPLKCLKRNLHGRYEFVMFWFDKYGDAKFTIILESISPKGIQLLNDGNVAIMNQPNPKELLRSAVLSKSKFESREFGLGFFSPKTEKELKRVVNSVLRKAPEVEEWFLNQTVGKHIIAT